MLQHEQALVQLEGHVALAAVDADDAAHARHKGAI